MKIQTLASIVAFSIITTSMVQASTHTNGTEVNALVSVETIYEDMSTSQLQIAVENHSMNGSLPFALGQELMKRWVQN